VLAGGLLELLGEAGGDGRVRAVVGGAFAGAAAG
jgi:hypothetical protein